MNGFAGLRIAVVGPLPPPAGGMARQTQQLAALLADAGAEVRVVRSNEACRPAWVERLPVVRAGWRLLPYLWRLWVATARSDVVHVMANSGWSWYLFAAPAVHIAALRGVPAVVNYRGGEAAAFLRRSHRRVARTLRRAAAVAVPSGYLQGVFAAHGIATCIVPNIVDLERFRPASARTLPRGAAEAGHVVVTRNLEPLYDNATAIRALALLRRRVPGVRLTLAGTGPELPALRVLARTLGVADAVAFPGRLGRDEVARLYRGADVALNPSTVDNMPNSVLEALASGVPVVSTRVGGVPHLVEDGTTALLVPPGEPAAMAQALERLLCSPALRRALAGAGLREARRYAWPQVAPRLEAVYRQAVAGGAARE